MGEWGRRRLRDVGVCLIDCVHKTPQGQSTGYPYVGIPQMKNGHVDFSTARLISREDYFEWTKKAKPEKFDVILSRRTNPGVTAVDDTGTEFALGQNLVLLRSNGMQVYPPFLKWMTQTPEWWEQISKFNNVGAVFDSLKCSDIPNFELPIPPYDTQRAITNILDILDDKIKLNQTMNETLDSMARAIFKDWFVDFGPTRAKLSGIASYLAPDIWSFFPDRLDNEGKPERWEIVPLAALIEVNPPEQLARGRPAPYLDMASIPTEGPNPEPYIIRECGSGMRFRNGDTLFARITPCLENGKTAFVQNLPSGEVGWGSTEFIVLRSRPPVPPAVSYLIARDPVFRANAIRNMTGTSGRQRVNNDAISTFPVVLPDSQVLWSKLDDLVTPLFDRIAANDLESRTLAATRDLLLPKLMSGEIRVKDAEKIVGQAT